MSRLQSDWQSCHRCRRLHYTAIAHYGISTDAQCVNSAKQLRQRSSRSELRYPPCGGVGCAYMVPPWLA
eukprot:m.1157676 g.1157676  ORF g.1157676 m.1157676 type:complete len:69 (+) comp24498_c0_seq5:2472-2678(+)